MGVSARVVCDSVSPTGDRLTTMEVMMHRFVLAEFNTHRVFSRNSASSRAIPVEKQLRRVIEDPAVPLSWPAEKSGMQGGEELEGKERGAALEQWLDARDSAVYHARALTKQRVHKSVVNRLLEPFMWHTVIVTSTEWDNFFRQRCSSLAQPEIRAAAEAMRTALETSSPTPVLEQNDWHLPYVRDDPEVNAWASGEGGSDVIAVRRLLCAVSAARCARVSYLTQAGKRDPEEDLRLFERLVTADPPHASPLEHVATPMTDLWFGNFTGWLQLRHKFFTP